MKKLLFIIPLLIISCQKNESIAETSTKIDSTNSAEKTDVKSDSAANGVVVLEKENSKKISQTFRVIDGDSIIKNINGAMIPLTISDEFTTDTQKFILKIKNFNSGKITGTVTSDNNDMNIRFNQIKLPDGNFDGPFGQELSYDIKEKGEVWLIVGKNLMASGKAKGKFTLILK